MNNSLEAEQLLKQRLSVFAGSFSLEAADAVLTQDEVEKEKLVSLLEHLVSQGKLETEGQGNNRRYRLSEELRQVGSVQLSASGAEDTVYSRLVDYYLRLAEQSLEGAFGPERALWINRLEQEHPNLQPVFTWLVEQGEAERGLRLAYLLQELWWEEHHTSEARIVLATFLALPEASAQTKTRAQCLDLAGGFALAQTDFAEARSFNREAVAIYRELGDKNDLAYALLHLAHVERYEGEYLTAQHHYQEALQIFRGLADQSGIDNAMGNLGSVALELGDYATADKLVKESLQRGREQGSEWGLALGIGTAAGVAAGLGQPERAIRLAGASAVHREHIGISLPLVYRERFEMMITSARQVLDESIQRELWEEGKNLSLEEATEYALNNSPISS